jgi:DnaK suppressor protein
MATKAKSPAKKPATKAAPKAKPAAKKAVKKPAATKAKTAAKPKTPAKKPVAVTAKRPASKTTATSTTTKSTTTAKKTGKKSPTVAKSPRAAKTTVEANVMNNVLDVRELDFQPYSLKESEEYMNAAQLEHFRKILLGWKQALMEQVDQTVSHMQNEPGNLADPNDCATREEEFNLELRTRDRERQLIKKIESTLQQIKQNEYGFCTQCGEEIGVRRLEARPTASLCIDCKTLAEIREKHYSS